MFLYFPTAFQGFYHFKGDELFIQVYCFTNDLKKEKYGEENFLIKTC